MEKILVVDDDYDIRKALEICLCDLGYSPIIAKDSKDVINGHHYEVVDLVITDYQMPWPDGLVLTEFFKKINIPVIVMSADWDIEGKVLSLSGSFLKKPFDGTELKELIEKLLKGGDKNECC